MSPSFFPFWYAAQLMSMMTTGCAGNDKPPRRFGEPSGPVLLHELPIHFEPEAGFVVEVDVAVPGFHVLRVEVVRDRVALRVAVRFHRVAAARKGHQQMPVYLGHGVGRDHHAM